MGGANFWGGTKEDDVSLKACFKMFSKMHNDVQMYHNNMKGFWCPEKCFCMNYFWFFYRHFRPQALMTRFWRWWQCLGVFRWPCLE